MIIVKVLSQTDTKVKVTISLFSHLCQWRADSFCFDVIFNHAFTFFLTLFKNVEVYEY